MKATSGGILLSSPRIELPIPRSIRTAIVVVRRGTSSWFPD
jgi:hypothetical protein